MRITLILSRCFLAFLLLTTLKASAQMEQPVMLNHVALHILDLKKGTDFYKNVIGLTEIPEPFHDGKHTWFKIGEHSQLHLIQGAGAITEHHKDSHLCFSVSSIENFIARLKKNNVPFGDWSGEMVK